MKVAVVYPYIPHYREAVFEALARSDARNQYVFFAGENVIDRSIRSELNGCPFEVRVTPISTLRGLVFQWGLLDAVLGCEFQALIFLGNPYFVTTWMYALAARLSGKRVSFWTHGWLGSESGIRGLVRRIFYRLPHSLMLYGERARAIGLASGFSPKRLHVIYNSLNYRKQEEVRHQIERHPSPRAMLPLEVRHLSQYVACVARLTQKCRLDMAIRALCHLQTGTETRIALVLVGDGPERATLGALARQLNVDVVFLGELYDESIIGPVLYHARVVVSPGKLGLTAMHSLAYGTPVLTHDDFSQQMPEHEAIVPGETGAFFSYGSVEALARRILEFAEHPRTNEERACCIAAVESRYTPERQVEFISAALSTSGQR